MNPPASARSFPASRTFLLKCLPVLLFGPLLGAPRPARAQTSGSYAQAESLVRDHHWDAGLSVLANLLKQEPRNLKALNLAGLALVGKNDTQQANEYFSRAIAIDPDFAPALKNLSINEFNARQYTQAEQHLLAAQKVTPDDPAIHLYLGEIDYRKQQYRIAAEQFGMANDFVRRSPVISAHLAASYLLTNDREKAVPILDTLQPATIDSKTQFELALALDQSGLPERALPYLEALRETFPDSYEIAFDLIVADFEAKRFPQAISLAKDLIARGRETAELDNVLAQAYEGDSQPQLALDAYRRAIRLDPQDEENYVDLASLCIDQHALQAGLTVIEVALKNRPNSARLVFMRGLIHATAGDMELAEADFKLSEKLAPNNDLGSIGLGDSYMETGHSAEAMRLLRKRLQEKPNDASLLYLLGESLLRTGALPGTPAYIEAQTALERSTTLAPALCLPHISLGTIYLDEGRNQDAVTQFEQARSIDPRERSIYSHLAVAYKRMGQSDKSRQVLAVLKTMLNQEQQDAIENMKSKTDPSSPAKPQ
jgi:predicted Zn-dependent protease